MSEPTDLYSLVRFIPRERPADRFVGAAVEKLTVPQGELTAIGVTEIVDRWNPATEAGQMIWHTFTRQFQNSKAKSILTKFEDALKGINQVLETAETKIDRPIDCAIAVLNGTDLYFSTVNNGQILLGRSNKFTKITSPAGQRFATVTSGELQEGDRLIFGNQTLIALSEEVSSKENARDLTADFLEDSISQQPAEVRHSLAGVFVEIGQKSELKTVYVDQAPKRFAVPKVALPKLPPLAKHSKTIASNLTKKLRDWQSSRVKPAAVEAENIETEAANNSATKNVKRWSLGAHRKLIPPVTFTVLLLIGLGIVYGQIKKLTTKEPTVSTPTIAGLITKTPESELFSFINQNMTIDNYQDLTDAERDNFNAALAKVGRTILTQETKAANLPEPIVALDSTATNLYAIDKTGQLWRYRGALTKVNQDGLVSGPVSLVALSDSKILVSDQAGGIWLLNGNGGPAVSLALPQHLAQGVKLLQKYGSSSNLYLYQVSSQTVYRVGGFISEIGEEPSLWIEPGVTAFGVLADWAISGDFLGVTDAGTLKSFSRTKQNALSVDYYQDNIPIRLTLGREDNQAVVARGKFITTYSTSDNSKITEHVLVTTDLISDVALGPNKTLWVAAGSALYQLP